MKKYYVFAIAFICVTDSIAQSNTFPASGNVGIGTLNPYAKFQVNSANGESTLRAIGTNGYMTVDNIGSGENYYQANSSHIFQGLSGTEVLRILGNGNVGIGTTSPSSRLDVVGGIKTSGNSEVNGVSFTSEDIYYKQIKSVGYNLRLASGAGDAHLLIPYNSSSPAHLYNFGLIVDKNVGIGTSSPTEKLSVNGKIRAKEIKVENANWPDYVFSKKYKLPSLAEIAKHIEEQGHLPGIPSATEVKANGIDLGEMNARLLQKIEELTLHLIKIEKESNVRNKQLQAEIDLLKSERK